VYQSCTEPGPVSIEDAQLNEEIISYYKHEREILLDPADSGIVETKNQVEELQKKLKRADDGRVMAPLPKLECKLPISRNTRASKAQVRSLMQRFDRDPGYYAKYRVSFDTWIKDGIIVPVTEEELKLVLLWCEMPHHGVDSAGKFRVVINGSAREPGAASSSQILDPGGNLLTAIIALMVRLRESKSFVVADIEKAFLQILLDHPDDHFFIIRWVEKDENGEWQERLYRFTRLPWGINTAPFILNAVIRYLYDEYVEKEMTEKTPAEKEKFKDLHNTTYADDILIFQDDEEDIIKVSKQLIEAMKLGKMNVCKFR